MVLLYILIIIATIPAIAFPIVYGITAKWNGSTMGRALMLSGASMALIMTTVVIHAVLGFDNYPGQTVVRMGIYSLIAIMLWTKLIGYTVTWRRYRKEKKEKENTP